MMRLLLPIRIGLLFCSIALNITRSSAQDFVLDSFPVSFQLFPRDLITNTARVPIQGKLLNTTKYSGVVIRVYKDFLSNGYAADDIIQTFIPQLDGQNNFKWVYELKTELFQYGFELGLILRSGLGTDNVRASLNNVAGDAYIINGQSNAEADNYAGSDANADIGTNLGRFVRVWGSGNEDWNGVLSIAQKWNYGDGNKGRSESWNVGQFGMRMAKRIIETDSVPIAILNGAAWGQFISYFQRNDANKYATNTNYGRLLRRADSSGLRRFIRGILWYQGEQNADPNAGVNYLSTEQYKTEFMKIRADWAEDYPSAKNIYLFQIRPGCQTSINAAAVLPIQQALYELDEENTDIRLISTNYADQTPVDPNATPLNYCHYTYVNGYARLGDRAFAAINNDIYGIPFASNQETPKPVLAYFSGIGSAGLANKVSLQLNNPGDTYTISPGMEQYFRLQGNGTYNITSVSNAIQNNLIEISYTLGTATANPTGITFLGRSGLAAPAIYNAGNIGLINFSNFPINLGILPVDPLALLVRRSGSANDIRWEADDNKEFLGFHVERSENGSIFTTIFQIDGNQLPGKQAYYFTDNKPNSTKSFYRIKAIRTNGSITYSQIVVVNSAMTQVKGIMTVYPNPVTDHSNISVVLSNKSAATLEIIDGMGRKVSSRKLNLQKGSNSFSAGEITDLPPGIYHLRLVTESEVFNSRVIKMR